MRIGELATVTGTPVATLKYYLREGLLHGGAATAVNQASYDDTHVQRVRLVRALLHMGHLSIADAQRVIAAVEDDRVDTHTMFGVAQDALVPAVERTSNRYPAARAEVEHVDPVARVLEDRPQQRRALAEAPLLAEQRRVALERLDHVRRRHRDRQLEREVAAGLGEARDRSVATDRQVWQGLEVEPAVVGAAACRQLAGREEVGVDFAEVADLADTGDDHGRLDPRVEVGD